MVLLEAGSTVSLSINEPTLDGLFPGLANKYLVRSHAGRPLTQRLIRAPSRCGV